MQLKEKIINKLKTVIDPEIKQDIYSLKLVYDLEVDEGSNTAKMKFRPTVSHCPIGIQLALSVKKALLEIDELEDVDVTVTDFFMAREANEYLESLKKNSIHHN